MNLMKCINKNQTNKTISDSMLKINFIVFNKLID